jgi:CRISPR-associated endoribonuclease Cas6
MSVNFDLIVHHLRFTAEARTIIRFGPQAGAQLRGALWAALQQFACTDSMARSRPDHSAHCPMCRLMALETLQSARGMNPARPFAIQPPLMTYFQSGEMFTFGISLFGDAADLFSYICQAVYRMGEIGVGYGRGQFILKQVEAINPLTGSTESVLRDRRISAPGIPVTADHIRQAAARLPTSQIRLRFLTPTQIIAEGSTMPQPEFDKLIARLLERCQSLELHYANQPTPQPLWRDLYFELTESAKNIRLAQNQTRWLHVQSGSRRSNFATSIGGFIGEVVYEGYLPLFREWLLWGQSVHVGKNAVKGNGWYEIVA